MGDYYAECQKPRLDGKPDGCQKFMIEKWRGIENCSVCSCHRNYHRYVEPPAKYITEVVYTKCHKIHEKFQNSVDGCQEFTPSGKDGSPLALTCAACGCHKGFHRNEVTKEVTPTS